MSEVLPPLPWCSKCGEHHESLKCNVPTYLWRIKYQVPGCQDEGTFQILSATERVAREAFAIGRPTFNVTKVTRL